mgnify:FL=1
MVLSPFQSQLIDYENGNLDFDDTLSLFQYIYETEAYKWLQGSYGRTLSALIEEGYIATFDD